jgi:hypothetical protein
MALNDFENVDFPEATGFRGSSFSTFEEGDMEVFEVSIAKAILKKQEALNAIDALTDAAGESWFELGEKLERKRILGVLDKFEEKLVDSEEDAKMTLAILRELIANAEEEGDGARD